MSNDYVSQEMIILMEMSLFLTMKCVNYRSCGRNWSTLDDGVSFFEVKRHWQVMDFSHERQNDQNNSLL